MKLLIAIIEQDYVKDVTHGLMDNKIRATKLASSGGFLKSGNTTLLIGVEEENLDKALEIIRENTEPKDVELEGEKVKVNANIFVLDMDKYLRI